MTAKVIHFPARNTAQKTINRQTVKAGILELIEAYNDERVTEFMFCVNGFQVGIGGDYRDNPAHARKAAMKMMSAVDAWANNLEITAPSA